MRKEQAWMSAPLMIWKKYRDSAQALSLFINTTAKAAIPLPSPTNPSFSDVVALMEISFLFIPMIFERTSCISGMRLLIFGLSRHTVVSILPIE